MCFDDADESLTSELYLILFKDTSLAKSIFNLSIVLVISPGILLTFVNDKDPPGCGRNISCNDLSPISNEIHRRCARDFLRSLIRSMCHLKHTGYLGFDTTSYNPSPRIMRSYRYTTNAKKPCVISLKTSKDNSRMFLLNLGLKYLRTRKYIIHIDEAVGNAM